MAWDHTLISRFVLGSALAVVAAVAACSGEAPDAEPRDPPATQAASGQGVVDLDARLHSLAARANGGLVRQGANWTSNPAKGRWLTLRLGERASQPWDVLPAGLQRMQLRVTETGAAAVGAEFRDGGVSYRNAYPNTDSLWWVTPAEARQIWVLKSADAPARFRWELELGSELRGPAAQPDGSFVFETADGRGVLRMPAPFARDARGMRHRVHLHWDPAERSFTFSFEHAALPHPVVVEPVLATVSHWKQLSPTSSPSARSAASMIYSPASQSMLLFGGVGCASLPSCLRDDLWEFKNGQWQAVTTTGPKPAPRAYATLVHDPTLGVARLYGGFDGTSALATEDWLTGGQQWSTVAIGSLPGNREGHTAAYVDSAAKMFVAFGQNAGTVLTDPWLGGSSWQSAAGGEPSARRDSGMAHDLTLDRTVVFGGRGCGRGQSCAPLGDLSARTGSTWSTLSATGSLPSARFGHSMAYDSSRLVTVVYAGRTATGVAADSYELDGSSFWLNDKTPAPPARAHAAMAFDASRGVMLLFGGNPLAVEPEASSGHLNDTWEYAPISVGCTQPSDCATGFCVDGACCDTAGCGTCESCGTAGSPGTCAAVDGPDPDSCASGTCSGGVCLKSIGSSCSDASECESAACTDGVCCDAECKGTCEVCSVAAGSSQDGSCEGAPRGTEQSEECPEGCSGKRNVCANNECSQGTDCSSGVCLGGRCCASLYDCGTRCSSDGKSEIDTLSSLETPCEYGCFHGRCARDPVDCRVSQACAAGEVCGNDGVCVAGNSAAQGESFDAGTPLGCLCQAPGSPGAPYSAWAGLLGGVALAFMRRRRQF